jgi:hypothetical protein
MNIKTAYKLTVDDKEQLEYRHLSLLKLVGLIVDHCDRQALNEFHTNRTLFTYNKNKPMLFIEFIDNLRKSFANRKWRGRNDIEIADTAYDLTLAKFIFIPNSEKNNFTTEKKNELRMKKTGTDCRYYFMAFLKYVSNLAECNHSDYQLKEEYYAARAMQSLVKRHFNLSLLEAKRKSNTFRSRYYWSIKGAKICVWLPKSIKGIDRREWLEKNIEKPNPDQPGERERIQLIIDQQLSKEQFIPISAMENKITKENSTFWSNSDEAYGIHLAKTVADEKAANIGNLRRSIQTLGKEKLKKLILCIFENISCKENNDFDLAKNFGISKASFSRFAGSQWFETDSKIPDLWLNTAHVLSTHSIFKAAAIETGVWNRVEAVLKKGMYQIKTKGSDYE